MRYLLRILRFLYCRINGIKLYVVEMINEDKVVMQCTESQFSIPMDMNLSYRV